MTEGFGRLRIFFIFPVFIAIILTPPAIAVSMSELTLQVYTDGVVVVEDKLFPEVNYGNVTVKLITPDVENILVIGEGGKLINYQLNGDRITIYGELSSPIVIHYETATLTRKNGSLWVLELCLPREAVVLMPSRSVILSLSDVPKMIAGETDFLRLILRPGSWKIEYAIQYERHSSVPETREGSYMFIISSLTGVSIALFSAILYIRRKRNSSILLDDEKRIFELVKKKKKISEAEIRALTHLPKTTVWRVVRRLERRGLVRIAKVRRRNEVELA